MKSKKKTKNKTKKTKLPGKSKSKKKKVDPVMERLLPFPPSTVVVSDREAIVFKDHLVHDGQGLTCQQIEDAILSEELKALDKGWIGRFWEYIASKIRKPLGF